MCFKHRFREQLWHLKALQTKLRNGDATAICRHVWQEARGHLGRRVVPNWPARPALGGKTFAVLRW